MRLSEPLDKKELVVDAQIRFLGIPGRKSEGDVPEKAHFGPTHHHASS